MDIQDSFGMEFRSVKEASVEGVQRRTKPKKHFMFCVKVTWSDGTVNLVYRRYSEFLHLQTILYQAFPESLGRPGATCSKSNHFTPLPDTFSTRMNVGEAIFRRMEQVNFFLKEILGLDTKVTQSKHIKSFLTPKPEDLEPEPRRQLPRKKKRSRGRSSSGNFSKTMKGRLQKFGKTKIFGNNISSPIVLEHFVVMEDYKKQAKTDINLKKGKTVDVVEKRECGWWLVDADGEVGWAPALYLEPADEMSDTEVSNVQRFPISKGEVFVTTKRYVAVEDDELSFDIGVNLQILEKNMDGWWKASYLGREGWVPQLYLRKLGTDRRGSRTARRKSRIISRTELRSPIEEEEDVIREIPEEKTVDNTDKEDKRMSLPRKISKQVFSAMGKKDSRGVSFAKSEEVADGTPQDNSKTIGTMVEMSNAFLQLNKSDKKSSDASSEERKRKTSEPSPKSSRPNVQRRAISSLALSTHHMEAPGGNNEDYKKDIDANKSKSRSLESLPSRKATPSVESKWQPEKSNTLSSSLSCLHEVPESDHNEIEDECNTQPNGISHEIAEDTEATTTLGDAEDSDTGSCDISSETTTLTDLMECLDGFCKQPVGDYVYYQKTSRDEDIPKFEPPRRSPPSPSTVSNNSNLNSPRAEPPRRNPPSPNTYPRGQRQLTAEAEQQKNHTIPKSNFDRKIIFQNSLERETAQELNEQIQVWSSSDESESDLEKLSSNRIVHPKLGNSPAIVIDELDDQSNGEETIHLKINDDLRSTESFEIEVNLQNDAESPRDEDGSTDIYCTAESHEVDGEIYLTKGDYVTVIERASTGYWLIQNEAGLRGWSFSGHFVPVHQVNGEDKSSSPKEEDREEDDDYPPQMFCRVICDYEADDDGEEIDLCEGDIMEIIFRNENGWWCVRNNTGEIGWAPSNYLEMPYSEESYEVDE